MDTLIAVWQERLKIRKITRARSSVIVLQGARAQKV